MCQILTSTETFFIVSKKANGPFSKANLRVQKTVFDRQAAFYVVIGSLNMLALPPAYMITPADWVAHQPLPPLVPPPVPAVPAPGLAGVPVGVAVGGAAPARAESGGAA